MTCDECSDLLGDAVDGALSPAQSAAVREHCDRCSSCRELLYDLLEIQRVAATLERRTPSPQLRDTIQSRLTDSGPAQRRSVWVPLAAAATLALVLGSATWFSIATRRAQAPVSAVELAQSAESELQLAEQHYEKAIAALEALTANKQSALDPQVAEAISQSLGIIDKAISDSRAALKAQPGSLVAQTSLLEALRMKMALLQETVSLMNPRS